MNLLLIFKKYKSSTACGRFPTFNNATTCALLPPFFPDTVDIAIERKQRVSTLPEWPEIKLYYFDQARMETGVTEITECGETFRIFDIEKTVVDIIYYRNKLGIEETSEILRNYLKRKDRQIDKLYNYSKALRCEKAVRTYLEVLI